MAAQIRPRMSIGPPRAFSFSSFSSRSLVFFAASTRAVSPFPASSRRCCTNVRGGCCCCCAGNKIFFQPDQVRRHFPFRISPRLPSLIPPAPRLRALRRPLLLLSRPLDWGCYFCLLLCHQFDRRQLPSPRCAAGDCRARNQLARSHIGDGPGGKPQHFRRARPGAPARVQKASHAMRMISLPPGPCCRAGDILNCRRAASLLDDGGKRRQHDAQQSFRQLGRRHASERVRSRRRPEKTTIRYASGRAAEFGTRNLRRHGQQDLAPDANAATKVKRMKSMYCSGAHTHAATLSHRRAATREYRFKNFSHSMGHLSSPSPSFSPTTIFAAAHHVSNAAFHFLPRSAYITSL